MESTPETEKQGKAGKRSLTSLLLFFAAGMAAALVVVGGKRLVTLADQAQGSSTSAVPGSGIANESSTFSSAKAKPDRRSVLGNEIVADINHHRFAAAERGIAELAALDPMAALERVRSLPAWARSQATNVLLGAWMKSAPDVAWQWAAKHDPAFFFTQEFIEAISTTNRFDLGLRAIETEKNSWQQALLEKTIFPAWAAKDYVTFSQWAVSQNGELRSNAMVSVISELARTNTFNLETAKNELGTGKTSPIRTRWNSLVADIAQRDGNDAATAFLQGLPQAPELEDAYGYMARQSNGKDALYWLDKVTPGSGKDFYSIVTVAVLEEKNPAMAASVATGINNQAGREEALIQILPHWATVDPAGMEKFLTTTTAFDQAAKNRLLLLAGLPPIH